MSVYGRRCLGFTKPGCKGVVHLEVSLLLLLCVVVSPWGFHGLCPLPIKHKIAVVHTGRAVAIIKSEPPREGRLKTSYDIRSGRHEHVCALMPAAAG